MSSDILKALDYCIGVVEADGRISMAAIIRDGIAEIKRLRTDRSHWHECFDRALDRETQKADEIKRLKTHVEHEYRRGLEEGSSCQAILEIQGQERFLAELKKDGCPGCRYKEAARAAGGE